MRAPACCRHVSVAIPSPVLPGDVTGSGAGALGVAVTWRAAKGLLRAWGVSECVRRQEVEGGKPGGRDAEELGHGDTLRPLGSDVVDVNGSLIAPSMGQNGLACQVPMLCSPAPRSRPPRINTSAALSAVLAQPPTPPRALLPPTALALFSSPNLLLKHTLLP